MISLNDESIALVRLGDVLGIPPLKSKTTEDLPVPVLILSLAPKKIAFIVDYIHGEQEGMVKDMGPQLIHVRNISGITVLGSGQIIPILNIPELMDSATHAFSPGAEQQPAYTESLSDHQKYILVAEDSITLRILLKNILESSGYMVKTAVDGMEAFQFLKNEVFDLVVSDVEMPRMNGFDLTSRIRNDKTLSETPVILVTALDSPEDRQKGIESGADAYIIKGNFEQSNLLDTIHRLI
jgi:two-component system chemotaxis sensor kinase CheA